MKTRPKASRIAVHPSRIEGDGMIIADPTFFWIFLIGFGVIALRMLERTHHEPERRVTEPVRSREDG